MKKKIAKPEAVGKRGGGVRKIPLRRFAYLFKLHCGRTLDEEVFRHYLQELEHIRNIPKQPPTEKVGYGTTGPAFKITRKITWKERRW